MQRVLEDARADRLEQLARMQQQHHHQGQLDKRISLGGAIGAGAAVRGSLDEGASEAPGGLGSLVRSSSDPGGIAAAAAALELGVGLQSVDEEREGVGKGGSSSGRVVEGGGQLPGGGGTSGTGAGGAGGAREAAGRLLARQRSGSTGSGTGVSRLANGSGGGGGGLSVELPTYRVQAVRSALPSPRFGAGGKTASVGALAGIEGVGAAQRWGRAPIPAAPVHAGPPTWVHVWQYAGRAVLHDLRERRTAWSLRDYLHNKGHYTRLYRRYEQCSSSAVARARAHIRACLFNWYADLVVKLVSSCRTCCANELLRLHIVCAGKLNWSQQDGLVGVLTGSWSTCGMVTRQAAAQQAWRQQRPSTRPH